MGGSKEITKRKKTGDKFFTLSQTPKGCQTEFNMFTVAPTLQDFDVIASIMT